MKHFHLFLILLLIAVSPLSASEELAILRQTADSLHSVGRTDSAVIVGQKAILLAEKSGNPTQIVGTHAAQGVFLRSLGQIEEALKSYETALEIVTSGKFRDNPDQEAIEEIASLYINLAVLNLDTGHKEQAASNAVLAGEWIGKSSDPELRSTINGVVGSVLTGCGQPEKAITYQTLAYKDALDAGDKESAFRAAAYNMLAAYRVGKKQDSETWRTKCNDLMSEVNSLMARLVYYQAECSIALTNKNPREAIKWFDKILSSDGIDNLPFVKFDCYNNLHIAYADLGEYKEAYSSLLQGNELRDSLWEQEKARSLEDLTVKYETKETELALAQSESRRTRTLMWLFAAVAALLIAVVIFLVYAGRQKRRRMEKEVEFAELRAKTERKLTKEYIQGLEAERDRMAKELHDGVCNDLLAIHMNIKQGKPIETTSSLIEDCRQAVRRISHELLPPEFEYANIDEVVKFYIRKLDENHFGDPRISYQSSATGRRWRDISQSTALDIYRIIQEAISNAIKHSGASEILVSMQLEADAITVKIHDNGTFKSNGRKGIGLESIKKRAKSLGGEINIEHSPENGTSITLTAALPNT